MVKPIIEIVNSEPNPEDRQIMVDGMLAYHKSKGHPRKTEFYSILLRGIDRKVVGTIVVSFLWNGMHINSLWIDDLIRNQGWGSKLLKMAEEEGMKRGCALAYTDTYSWQAPLFYEKMGYALYGKLDDFPKGSSLSYYCKKLC